MKDIKEIMELLEEAYPEAGCTLRYSDPLQLLIATILAAQCTDARVNLVTPALFKRYPDCNAFAEADAHELEEYIRSTGFYRNKARNIIECCKRLKDVYNCVVPDNMEDLLTLAGVGRKTANIILGDVYNKPAVVVDTHAKRLSNRIGLSKHKDPTKIEMDLAKILPPDRSARFCHQLVYHGRAVCNARNPKCEICVIKEHCDYYRNLTE